MKICLPSEEDKGLESEVFNHFGSAPLFIVFDTEKKSVSTIKNQDLNHVHGKCNPLKALDGKMVECIIVGGIGAGAISRLNEMGIKVYKAVDGTVQKNIDVFLGSSMTEMTVNQACGGHKGECSH